MLQKIVLKARENKLRNMKKYSLDQQMASNPT